MKPAIADAINVLTNAIETQNGISEALTLFTLALLSEVQDMITAAHDDHPVS